jgi:hypothetical protein
MLHLVGCKGRLATNQLKHFWDFVPWSMASHRLLRGTANRATWLPGMLVPSVCQCYEWTPLTSTQRMKARVGFTHPPPTYHFPKMFTILFAQKGGEGCKLFLVLLTVHAGAVTHPFSFPLPWVNWPPSFLPSGWEQSMDSQSTSSIMHPSHGSPT